MNLTRRVAIGGLAAAIFPLARASAATSRDTGIITIEAAPGQLQLLPKGKAETGVWAFNGQVPGPLLRIKKGDAIKVRLVNKLAQPTTLCWHGVRIVNAMDGVAGLTQAAVPPGQSFDYRFTPPDAGFYWYHPHAYPDSEEQIGRGLYGLLIVDEPEPPAVDQDHLLVIDDWPLDAKGQIAAPAVTSAAEPPASITTVNSKPIPGEAVPVTPGARLRFRLINVSAARIAVVTFAGLTPSVVAIDGQPSELFPPAGGTLPIGPGARFEVIADVGPAGAKPPALLLRADDGKFRPLMTFAVKGSPAPARPPITRLPENPLLPTRIPLEKAIKPIFEIAGGPKPQRSAAGPATPSRAWSLAGSSSNGFASSPLFKIKRGGAVSLAFVNKTAAIQQMHVHGHVFRVLHDLDDGWDPYWRESILIAPGRTKHVAFIADNPGKWAIESLMLDRQVRGLAGWFEVSER